MICDQTILQNRNEEKNVTIENVVNEWLIVWITSIPSAGGSFLRTW